MRFLFLACCSFIFSVAAAQPNAQYAAAKAGLSMRQQPAATAPVLQKIAYGQKIQPLSDTATPVKIITEGFEGYWQKVKYNNQVGYVVSSYLFPVAPPKAAVKTMKDYLAQITTTFGQAVVVTKGSRENSGDYFSQIKKQLYKNGAEYHESQWYESSSETIILPEFSIEQAFLLVRLLGCCELEVGSTAAFPVKNEVVKLKYSDKRTTVDKLKWSDGTEGPVNKITIETEEGGSCGLEIFLLDMQAVIIYGCGA